MPILERDANSRATFYKTWRLSSWIAMAITDVANHPCDVKKTIGNGNELSQCKNEAIQFLPCVSAAKASIPVRVRRRPRPSSSFVVARRVVGADAFIAYLRTARAASPVAVGAPRTAAAPWGNDSLSSPFRARSR